MIYMEKGKTYLAFLSFPSFFPLPVLFCRHWIGYEKGGCLGGLALIGS